MNDIVNSCDQQNIGTIIPDNTSIDCSKIDCSEIPFTIVNLSYTQREATMQLKITRHKVNKQIISIKQKWIIKEFDKSGTLSNIKEEWCDIDEEVLEG